MKNVIHLFICITLPSCVGYKTTDFNNEIFVSEPTHMMGETQIQFYNDSIYALKEMSGNLYAVGTWQLSEDKILISSNRKESKGTEIPQPPFLLNFFEKALLIKNRDKLLYDNLVLMKKN